MAGIKEAAQAAAISAFESIGDLLEDVTYTSRGNPVKNTSTGAVTNTDVDYPVDMLITDYDVREIDGQNVLAYDAKVMVPCVSLTPAPSTRDFITRADGTILKIMNFKRDPAEAMWEIQARR
jgi:hypothetical protein